MYGIEKTATSYTLVINFVRMWRNLIIFLGKHTYFLQQVKYTRKKIKEEKLESLRLKIIIAVSNMYVWRIILGVREEIGTISYGYC